MILSIFPSVQVVTTWGLIDNLEGSFTTETGLIKKSGLRSVPAL